MNTNPSASIGKTVGDISPIDPPNNANNEIETLINNVSQEIEYEKKQIFIISY